MASGPRLVHKQFNSPIGLYSQQNIQDTLSRHAQQLQNGAVGIDFSDPVTSKPANLANSSVLRLLEEEEERQRRGNQPRRNSGQVRAIKANTKRIEHRFDWPPRGDKPRLGTWERKGLKKVVWPPEQEVNGHYHHPQLGDYPQETPVYYNNSVPATAQVSPRYNYEANEYPNNYYPQQAPASHAVCEGKLQAPAAINRLIPIKQTNQPYREQPKSYQQPQSYQQHQPYQPPPQTYQQAQSFQQPQQQHSYQQPQSYRPEPPKQYQQNRAYNTLPNRPWTQRKQAPQPVKAYQPLQLNGVPVSPRPFSPQALSPRSQGQTSPRGWAPVHSPVSNPVAPPVYFNQPQYDHYTGGQSQGPLSPIAQPYRPEPPPTTITLRQSVPVHQRPPPVFTSQPATASFQGGVNMRGDQKWPPQNVKDAVEAENEARRLLAKGPACRPRRVKKDYTQFFAQNALNQQYPAYRAPPGTQHYDDQSGQTQF